MNKRILFIGMPDMATICLSKLIENEIRPVGVVLPDKSNAGRSSLETIAKSNDIKVFEYENSPNEPLFIEQIKALKADVGVMCSFNHKLSKEFLSSTKDGFINCHPSLLPDYRGGNPYFHIINNGEEFSAITLHFADTSFDTGNIIAQEVFPLDPKETMGMLFSRTNFMIADLLLKVIKQYEEQGNIISIEQPEGNFKKAPNVKGDFRINWAEGVLRTERLVRAANPFYNALTNFRGGLIKIITGTCKLQDHKRPFGEITKVKKDLIEIASGGGFYYPKVIQVGSWGIYGVEEFIEKFDPRQGEILK